MSPSPLLLVLVLCAIFLAACSPKPRVTGGPLLGFGDFVEQVLKPLSAERATEVISLEKARIEAERSRISMTAVAAATGAAIGAYSSAGLGTGVGAAVGGAIGSAIVATAANARKDVLPGAEAQKN